VQCPGGLPVLFASVFDANNTGKDHGRARQRRTGLVLPE
jgi:hypothetical protein